MAKPVVSIKDLSVVYNPGKPTEFQALTDINLEIFPEEFVIFFGPSGSGKSTLLYIIAGLETPAKGKVSVGDIPNLSDLTENELIEFHRSAVGMIFQAFYLIPGLTAKDNVLLPMVFAGSAQHKRDEIIDPLLDRFGITSFKDRTPVHLSGGQQQRVAIARSLINDPSIVLADEPVGNLDSKNADIVLELIRELHTKDKKTVVLVTHDPRHIKLANRVFYIKDGKIERVVVQKPAPISGTDEAEPQTTKDEHKNSLLDRLALLYPNLNTTQLKAKVLINLILSPYDVETMQSVEEVAAKYITKSISKNELLAQLDNPVELGGLGLYAQVSERIVEELDKLLAEMKLIDASSHSRKKPDSTWDQPEQLGRFVQKELEIVLSLKKQAALVVAIKNRLTGELTAQNFLKQIDKPEDEGGVGLDARTAERMAREVEVLLMEKEAKSEPKTKSKATPKVEVENL